MHDQRHAMSPFELFGNFAKLRRTARKFHFSQVNNRTHIENMAAVTLLRRRASFWLREILAGGCADWTVVTNGIRKMYLYVYGSQRLLDIRCVYQSAGLKRLRPWSRKQWFDSLCFTAVKQGQCKREMIYQCQRQRWGLCNWCKPTTEHRRNEISPPNEW